MLGRRNFTAALAAALSAIPEIARGGLEDLVDLRAGARRFQLENFMPLPQGWGGRHKRRVDRRKGKSGVRLRRARGPGSINARADGLQLARMGLWAEAAEMLYEVDRDLSVRYRGFVTGGVDTSDLQNLSRSFPLTSRLVP